ADGELIGGDAWVRRAGAEIEVDRGIDAREGRRAIEGLELRGIIITIETRAGPGGAHDEGSTAAGDRLTKHVSNDNAVESAVRGLSIIDRVSTGRRAGEIGSVLPPLISEGRNAAGHADVESDGAADGNDLIESLVGDSQSR